MMAYAAKTGPCELHTKPWDHHCKMSEKMQKGQLREVRGEVVGKGFEAAEKQLWK